MECPNCDKLKTEIELLERKVEELELSNMKLQTSIEHARFF